MPHAWTEGYDKLNQSFYYYNSQTNETTDDRPEDGLFDPYNLNHRDTNVAKWQISSKMLNDSAEKHTRKKTLERTASATSVQPHAPAVTDPPVNQTCLAHCLLALGGIVTLGCLTGTMVITVCLCSMLFHFCKSFASWFTALFGRVMQFVIVPTCCTLLACCLGYVGYCQFEPAFSSSSPVFEILTQSCGPVAQQIGNVSYSASSFAWSLVPPEMMKVVLAQP